MARQRVPRKQRIRIRIEAFDAARPIDHREVETVIDASNWREVASEEGRIEGVALDALNAVLLACERTRPEKLRLVA